MSFETVDSAVKTAAQTLTMNDTVLTIPSEEYPISVYANSFNVDETPNQVEMSNDVAVAVENHFEEVNQETVSTVDEEREAMIENTNLALAKVQYNTTEVIVPAIEAMHADYASRFHVSSQPDCTVESFRYDEVHNDPRLVNHVNSRYASIDIQPQYRTHILRPITVDAIIESVAVNNPHLDQTQVTEWLLKMKPETINAVWDSLFGNDRSVYPGNLSYTNPRNPFTIDELLLAYCLCGHYIENPQEVIDESVTLDEWNFNMKVLHEMFGRTLLAAYAYRAENREEGVIILKAVANDAIAQRRVNVMLNGDIADQWLADGGDVNVLLGAALDGNCTTVAHINSKTEELVNRWLNVYPLIKQSAIDYADKYRKNDIINSFISQVMETPLRDRPIEDLRDKLEEAFGYVRIEDLRNPYRIFTLLICHVYFPDSLYLAYLEAIDEFGINFPKASLRELSTQATITLMALYLARQIKVEAFAADVDPEATLEVQEVPAATEGEEEVDITIDESADADTDVETDEVDIEVADDEEDNDNPYADIPDEVEDEEPEVEDTPDETSDTSDDEEEETPLA